MFGGCGGNDISFNEAADLSPRIVEGSAATFEEVAAGFNEAADLSPRIGPTPKCWPAGGSLLQ